MKTCIIVTATTLLLALGAGGASAYNPCDPKYDTCQ